MNQVHYLKESFASLTYSNYRLLLRLRIFDSPVRSQFSTVFKSLFRRIALPY